MYADQSEIDTAGFNGLHSGDTPRHDVACIRGAFTDKSASTFGSKIAAAYSVEAMRMVWGLVAGSNRSPRRTVSSREIGLDLSRKAARFYRPQACSETRQADRSVRVGLP
jgi:hypothetical protein